MRLGELLHQLGFVECGKGLAELALVEVDTILQRLLSLGKIARGRRANRSRQVRELGFDRWPKVLGFKHG